jgi:hypothetical protein
MKKILLSVSALLLAAAIVVSCNKNSPKEVANTWLTDFYHMDYDAAKKVSTDDTKNILAQLQQLSNMISDSSKKEQKKIVITIKDVKEEGDKATVSYTTSSDSPNSKDDILKLVKQNGQWLVQFSKNDSMGDAGGSGDQSMGSDSTGAAPADSLSTPDTSKH